ncbi:MAG: thiamine phosphate synthase [Pseudomonadota bacterium]
MADEQPQIYLITPQNFELSTFSTDLSRLLDSFAIACVRLRAGEDAAALSRNADALRAICHERDVPLVLETHTGLAAQHGLDGVHLTDGARSVAAARKDVPEDGIIGAFCEDSRHTGISAGEAGADYIAFGPVAPDTLAANPPVEAETLTWWSQMIEIPVVVEGGLTLELAESLAPVVDFLAFGSEIWSHGAGPDAALAAFMERLS